MTDDTERALGRVEGTLESLSELVLRSEKSSNEGRAKLYQAVEDVRGEVRDLKSDFKTMDARLKDIEPIVSELSKWRQRGIGVLMFLAFLAAALGAVITALWDKALHAVGLK